VAPERRFAPRIERFALAPARSRRGATTVLLPSKPRRRTTCSSSGPTPASRYDSCGAIRDRLLTTLTLTFAALALGLACLGLYGVTSYTTARPTNEIGIRVALGSTRPAVLKHVIGRSVALALGGVALGVVGTLGASRYIADRLYGVSAFDPPTIGAVSLVMLLVTTVASYVPARRAASVNPVVALRADWWLGLLTNGTTIHRINGEFKDWTCLELLFDSVDCRSVREMPRR
jgi:ABC-type antimicrobial peptide transport system permease subunit